MNAAQYKMARQLRGTQSQVAAQLGVTQVTMSRRERGECLITREMTLAINSLSKKTSLKKNRASNA